ncbi:branched-chain amino acid aminotransferase [Luteococcus sp. Sow4_B9]|uniref:branched-chain amino acid aminotransferase n=1 Tax=Luteococcus sp. Sow4_B9 TaxID=3438792 RepID=UPI003F9B2C0C
MPLQFEVRDHQQLTDQSRLDEILSNPGFGDHFSEHMAGATWTKDAGWHDARIERYGNLSFTPGSAVFHYAQEIFEGLKAYRRSDGSIWLFRPEANGERMMRSAERLALPPLPTEDFVASIVDLVKVDQRWVPGGAEQSLYLRPFTIAHEVFLGVRAAQTASYHVIASPVGGYFKGGVSTVDIWVSLDSSRAGAGGTGAAKCGGNYAASLQATNEAYAQGCSQVLFLDATDRTHIDELGGMNFFVVTNDAQLVTPELTGNILPGITRDSILRLAPDLGLQPVERRLALDEVLSGIEDGTITEAFACGTAAVVTPIRSLKVQDRVHTLQEQADSWSLKIRRQLVDIQYGRADDPYGWTVRVC